MMKSFIIISNGTTQKRKRNKPSISYLQTQIEVLTERTTINCKVPDGTAKVRSQTSSRLDTGRVMKINSARIREVRGNTTTTFLDIRACLFAYSSRVKNCIGRELDMFGEWERKIHLRERS